MPWLSFFIAVFLECHGDGGAFAYGAVQLDYSAVICRRVLYNGETQSCAPRLFRVALVNPVKALEDAVLMFGGYSDTRVADSKHDIIVILFNRYFYLSAFRIITYGIVAEVLADLIQITANAVYCEVLSLQRNVNLLFCRRRAQYINNFT